MPDKAVQIVTKGDQCRCRILEAARKLFYQKGFLATSINDVALEAGVLKGNLSYYFPSKSKLLESTTAARSQEIKELLEEWSRDCDHPYDALEQFIAMYEQSAQDIAHYGCDIGTLTEELGKGEGVLQHQTRPILDLLQSWLTTQFSQYLSKKTASEYAEHLFSIMQGAAVLAHSYRDPKVILRQGKLARNWLEMVFEKSAHQLTISSTR